MQREVQLLGSALNAPRQPLVAILGGAKVSDKIKVLEHLTTKVDKLLIGGRHGRRLSQVERLDVGSSLVEDDSLGAAREICVIAERRGVELLLPTDVVVADAFSESRRSPCCRRGRDPIRLDDHGRRPETAETYAAAVEGAGTVVWNGTMGVSEWPPFSHGTERVAHALAELDDAVTVLGGGSTGEAVQAMGLADSMTHVSTGGGASLEFLEGSTLPGVEALMR